MSNKSYEGFTVSLALTDCLPVLFCSVTLATLAGRSDSLLFKTAAVVIIASGFLKCLWKFIIAIKGKDVRWLFYQMRVAMPAGFLMAIVSLYISRGALSFEAIWAQISRYPNIVFYIMGFLGMLCMVWFATHLESDDASSNWAEQGTNALAQFCIMLGVLL